MRVLALIAVLGFASCHSGANRTDVEPTADAAPAAPAIERVESAAPSGEQFVRLDVVDSAGGKASVEFEGVAFQFDRDLAPEVYGAVLAAYPLEDATSKPDPVASSRVVFAFGSDLAGKDANGYYSYPHVVVYSVAGFRTAFALEPKYIEAFDAKYRALRMMLRKKPRVVRTEIPYLPSVDASQTVNARLRYVEFAGGEGVRSLTQWQQEPTLVCNGRLEYQFQGLADDGDRYVVVNFPVRSDRLPEESAHGDRGYELSQVAFDDSAQGRANRRAYDAYLRRVTRDLRRFRRENFSPRLEAIDALCASLKIE